MHDRAYNFVKSLAPMIPRSARVCEIGSRNVNGSVRDLFRGRLYIGVDREKGPGVDITADGATWMYDPFDCVICTEVLEHAERAAMLCDNIVRLLKNKGVAIITAASPSRSPHSGLDGGPVRPGEHYQGVTKRNLEDWFEKCSAVLVDDRTKDDIYCLVIK